MSINSIGKQAGFTMTVEARRDAAKAIEASRELQATNGKVVEEYGQKERANLVEAQDKRDAAQTQAVADERRIQGQKEADVLRERYQEDARVAQEAVVVGRLIDAVG